MRPSTSERVGSRDLAFGRFGTDAFQVVGDRRVVVLHVQLGELEGARLLLDRNDVVGADEQAGDGTLAAIEKHLAVRHHLAGIGRTARSRADGRCCPAAAP